jgi:hypothetical protein
VPVKLRRGPWSTACPAVGASDLTGASSTMYACL